MANLTEAGFVSSSPIQEHSIPLILEGKDIFAQAETGSGKTGAFAIPVIQKQIASGQKGLCLVLSPTRELAQQTHRAFETFGRNVGITAVNVIGGESMSKQQKLLENGVTVIVGTPGRINDMARKRHINLKAVDTVVFDEADRLFDMGFKKDIEYLLKMIPSKRQMIMMSATTNQDVLRTAYKFHSQPEEIRLSEDNLVVDAIDQSLVMINYKEKFPYLVNLLRVEKPESSFIFCNTQFETHLVGEWLTRMGFKASFISGKLAQNKRTRLIQDFRDKKIQHLVCTDVAARGLDIKNVQLVVNYQLPNEADNYVHRVGRTGRAGESGKAISFCAFEDCENLEGIKSVLGEDIPKIDVEDKDFAQDVCGRPRIDGKTLKVLDRKPQKEKMEKTMAKKEKKVKQTTSRNSAPRSPSLAPFMVTAENYDEALNQALGHFKVKDPEMLENKVVKKTGKKFLMFGKEEITYEFTKKTKGKKQRKSAGEKKMNADENAQGNRAETSQTDKKRTAEPVDFTGTPEKLEPFITELFAKMGLELTFEIEVQDRRMKVDIRGEDIGLVLTNKKQLMFSIETIIRQFLFRRELINKQSQLAVYAHGTNPKPARTTSRYDDIEEEDDDNIGNREHHGEREFNGADYGEVKRERRPRRRNPNGNRSGNGNRRSASGRGGNRNGNRAGGGRRRDNRPQNHTDEFLQDMARILRDQVLEEGEVRMTKSLNPYERRIVHETLHDDQRVKTESEGDGKYKQIKIVKIAD
ncbi:MAG: hypothetical protein CME65_12865 [Halobacteriovoraceae bacterium]|nr:hypothetical protein [Halobacteriovoraceae bacterium]|tara:strand:- start:4122 stop:6374 length:2253 start_codon:yes stop_codon:yes gene_type:complete